MLKSYQIIEEKKSPRISTQEQRELAGFFAEHGQLLLPMTELIEQSKLAVDELIAVTGRAAIEAVLELSAEGMAGPRHPGKAGGEIRRHGSQAGTVRLSNRKLRVQRPRLRRKGAGRGAEEAIPAYEAMQDDARLSERMLEILMKGVSTRQYRGVIGEMAETVGVSKSAVSREFQEAGARELARLCERCFDEAVILVIYLDGQRFGPHHVISAVGVDAQGGKHVLGLYAGATESEAVVKGLLEDLVARGVKADRKRLFVIDGSKALRAAIDAVYGEQNPVQRCRCHKLKNVLGHLPKELHDQVRSVMKAAWRLEGREGMAKLEKQAQWLETEYPSAAASLREGLAETFTVNRLGLPPSLRRCLSTTNLIESSHSGVRLRTRRVCRWRDQGMVLNWAAAAWSATEANFRRIQGYRDLWVLEAVLKEEEVAERRKVG